MKVKFEIELMAHEGRELLELLCKFNGTELTNKAVTYPVQQEILQPVETPVMPAEPVHLNVVNYQTSAPVITDTYTLEQLAVAASTQLVDAGRRNELLDLLGLFGVQSMAQLPLESYGLFATHLKSKGVKI